MKYKYSIRELKNLSLFELRDKVKEIRSKLSQKKQKTITFSKNFTLSLSNYCRNNCTYCYYNHRIPKDNRDKNTILLEIDKIQEYIDRGKEFNCKEALLMSGEKPGDYSVVQEELKKRNYINYIDYVNDICKLTLKNKILPHLNIGVLSYDELKRLKDNTVSMGLMLESSNQKLMERGCVHESSPGKAPKIRIKHIEEAGKLKIPFTTGLLIGIGESLDDRIKDLLLIKELNDQYNHIQEVIIQNFKEKKNIVYSPQNKIQMKDFLKIVGIARVIFKNQISIQIPPNLTENLIEFFRMGVSDLGGISPFSIDYINPEKKWPQVSYLESLCRKNGYILKERLAVYRKFLNRSKFINKKVLNLIKEIYNSSKFI